LKSQVQSEHNKQLKGRSKKTLEASDNYFDDYDDNDSINETHTVRGRLCEQTLSKKGGGSVVTVSKAKLLEASLLSLETLGRQRYTGAPDGDSGFPQGRLCINSNGCVHLYMDQFIDSHEQIYNYVCIRISISIYICLYAFMCIYT
jgi:hypothetical protein